MRSIRRFVRSLKVSSRLTILPFLLLCSTLPTYGQTPTTTGDGWVVLPVAEYQALRRSAFPGEIDPSPPPVEATLTRIDYELKVDGDIATGEARLTVDVIKNGWVTIAIPSGLMVREARLDGMPVTLVARPQEKGPGGADLLLSKSGRAVLTLKIVAPIATVAGTEILRLPISNSAVSRAAVVLSRQDVEVNVTGGLLLDHVNTGSESRWTANGQGTDSLTFGWRRRIDDQRLKQALRMRGNVSTLVALGEDSSHINAEVQIEVVQGMAQDVRIKLPEQFTVNQVSGAMVADWDTKPGELIVSFIDPVQQSTRFTINAEVRLPRAGKMDVPLLRLQSVERESGGIAVEVLGAGEIKERQASGLDETEAAELGQVISSRQSPSLIAFRLQPGDGNLARSLSINVARYTPQAVLTANIEEADYKALVTADGKILVQSRFAVRNNQRNFLKLNLPASAILWSASVAGKPIRPGRAPDGSLLLPLEKMRSGEDAATFVVEVSYLDRAALWTDRGRFQLSLVSVDLPISKSHLLLHHSPLFRLTSPVGMSSSFRIAPFEASTSTALQSTQASSSYQPSATGPELTQKSATAGKRPTKPLRNLPLRVAFPHFGPSVFMIAELTSENQTPVVDLDFQRDRKRGVK